MIRRPSVLRRPSRRALTATAVTVVLVSGLTAGAATVRGGDRAVDLTSASTAQGTSLDRTAAAEAANRSEERTAAAAADAASAAAAADAQQEADLQAAADEARAQIAAQHQAEADARAAAEAAAAEAAAAAARQAVIDAAVADPRAAGAQLAAERGWTGSQFSCLDSLWTRESGWSWSADNPSSSAYGIPQSLPGSKMASAGADWETNPITQITWGLDYIADVYGSPCSAWAHSESVNWY